MSQDQVGAKEVQLEGAVGTSSSAATVQSTRRRKHLIIGSVLGLAAIAGTVGAVVAVTSGGHDDTDCDIPLNLTTPQNVSSTRSFLSSLFQSESPPTELGRNEVEATVWSEMKGWTPTTKLPSPKIPPMADIDMYMWSNTMSMTNTKFSAGAAKSGRRLAGQRDQECIDAMDLANKIPSYKTKDVKIIGWNAGPLSYNMYMTKNEMQMNDNTFVWNKATKKKSKIVLDSDNLKTPSKAKKVKTTINDQPNNLYMFKNSLTMQTTTFNMNVGTTGSEMDEINLASSMGTFDIDTLTLNMYMCHNEMSMKNTKFAMNLFGGIDYSDATSAQTLLNEVQSGNDKSLDLSRAMFLAVSSLNSDSRRLSEETGVEMSGFNVFQWMMDLAKGKKNLQINMHMYNNEMSMIDTIFTWNVASPDSFSDRFEMSANTTTPIEEVPDIDSSHMEDEIPIIETERRLREGQFPRRRLGSEDLYMTNGALKMTDTALDMNVGIAGTQLKLTKGEEQKLGMAPLGMAMKKLVIKMYMYSNNMEMVDTDFSSTMH